VAVVSAGLYAICTSPQTGMDEAKILRLGGLSPSHGERGSEILYRGSGVEPQWGPGSRAPGGRSGVNSPEAQSSVAFEAPAEEPNLILVTHSFFAVHTEKH